MSVPAPQIVFQVFITCEYTAAGHFMTYYFKHYNKSALSGVLLNGRNYFCPVVVKWRF